LLFARTKPNSLLLHPNLPMCFEYARAWCSARLTFPKVIASTLPFWEIVPEIIIEPPFPQILADTECPSRNRKRVPRRRDLGPELCSESRGGHENTHGHRPKMPAALPHSLHRNKCYGALKTKQLQLWVECVVEKRKSKGKARSVVRANTLGENFN
jgi:hypothetical protein